MTNSVLVRSAPILLDQILAAELGPRLARDLLPEALRLNPGLADAGAVIPIGTTVIVPDRPQGAATAPQAVDLYGRARS